MNLITIFNYPNTYNYNVMCKAWLEQAYYYAEDFHIKILSDKPLNGFLNNLLKEFNSNEVSHEVRNYSSDNIFSNYPKARHNVEFKLYNLSLEKEPFIFIDADAFILNDLTKLKDLSENQEFVAINHQNIEGHTSHINYNFLNSGVQIVNDPIVYNYNEFIKTLKEDNGFKVPGTDQSILWSYFNKINYDYTNKNIGAEWNSYAPYTYWIDSENDIAKSKLMENENVYINHYWYKLKPWDLNCPVFERNLK